MGRIRGVVYASSVLWCFASSGTWVGIGRRVSKSLDGK